MPEYHLRVILETFGVSEQQGAYSNYFVAGYFTPCVITFNFFL